MLNPTVLHQYKNQTRDSASLMPDMSGKNILMGFWHNWAPEQGQGYQGGMFAEMALTDIPVEYNVVAVAFMKGSGIPTFKPYRYSDAEFRQQINVLNAQGRAVLISLGGADAHIELYAGQEDMLAYELIRLVETYGFDGLDIDLEQSAITFADNRTVIPAALRMVKQHYAQEGKHFIISMAPEFPYLRDSGSYLAYLKALEDIYDFIAPQYYNQGGDGVWVDELNQLVKQNDDAMKEDFLYYLTDSLVHGTRGFTAIPADKFIIGLPANIDGAANGYVIHPQDAINALERLDKAGNPIRGLMTWSVSWDDGVNKSGKPYDWEFVTRYGFLTGGGSGEKPSAPANLVATAQTQSSITLSWSASSGANPIAHYSVFRDNQKIAQPTATHFVDSGLAAGTQYRYTLSATDTEGNSSSSSAPLLASTLPGAAPQWRTEQWYNRGDRVSYAGNTYLCIQEHTSNRFWIPSLADMLWQVEKRR
ncbi:hypothetical protein ALQ63_01492 [Serratia plymuthica]|uniref:glycosyl hydrolase family 18 protein n=1 Tax=Serratia plymuthica TaxID=82996 RepID=UPI000EFFAEE5|nr:glycosyl hydrolase family 18 protein [Serratia plymuthica]RMN19795.1 hypothetical protein ALQ63_01492 [Serratia plymuthica]